MTSLPQDAVVTALALLISAAPFIGERLLATPRAKSQLSRCENSGANPLLARSGDRPWPEVLMWSLAMVLFPGHLAGLYAGHQGRNGDG